MYYTDICCGGFHDW